MLKNRTPPGLLSVVDTRRTGGPGSKHYPVLQTLVCRLLGSVIVRALVVVESVSEFLQDRPGRLIERSDNFVVEWSCGVARVLPDALWGSRADKCAGDFRIGNCPSDGKCGDRNIGAQGNFPDAIECCLRFIFNACTSMSRENIVGTVEMSNAPLPLWYIRQTRILFREDSLKQCEISDYPYSFAGQGRQHLELYGTTEEIVWKLIDGY